MIEKLTQAQIDRFPEFVDKWTRIGLCTDPADRPRAEAGIRESYKIAGLEPPKRIVWCGSPLSAGLTRALMLESKESDVGESVRESVAASVADSVRASVWNSVADSVAASVWASVWDSVADSVAASVWDSVRASVWASVMDSVHGQHDASWLGFYDYFREVCGLSKETQKLCGLWEVAQSAGWWLPHENICWVSERHHTLELNADGLLHCESGPAVEYPDGFQVWAIDGIRVDEQIVLRPESQTLSQIDNEQNGDVRSIRIERFGWPRYLRESGAQVIDSRTNEIEGTMESLCRTKDGSLRLMATCPSGKQVCMGLPPGEVETCEQAQRWLAGPFSNRVCIGRT